MDFKKYLEKNALELDQEIEQILADWLNQVKKINLKLIPLALAFINACKGGKRVRGVLVKLGYELAEGHLRGETKLSPGAHLGGEIIRIGAALEILHASILAHDDIIDKSILRRGQKTLYQALGGDHYGISQAIGLADIGFFMCMKIISQANFYDQEKNQAIMVVSDMMMDTGLGEVLDVEVPHLSGQGTGYSGQEEDVLAIHRLKTAQYTISGPLQIGATLAGAQEQLLGKLAEFGENLGIAFQIQDDILGVFGDEKELGKSASSDIEEGKNTLLITEALKRANAVQKQILERFYGHGQVGDRGLEEVRKVFLETGALDYSRQMGVKYVNQAKSVVPKITEDPKMIRLLTEMADFLVERSK